MNKKFSLVLDNHIETLRQYVPIVKRVHGELHPEFIDVARNFESLDKKVKEGNLDLLVEFDNLNKITNKYLIPTDVCESYAHVYNLLKELDESFRSNL